MNSREFWKSVGQFLSVVGHKANGPVLNQAHGPITVPLWFEYPRRVREGKLLGRWQHQLKFQPNSLACL